MLSMWDVIICIDKNKRIIALITLIFVFIGWFYVKTNQSYTAEIVIKYIGAKSDKGLTENGMPLDPYEINNPQVIERALEQLSLPKSSSTFVRNKIVISPIIPTREEQKDESLIENAFKHGDEKKYHPVYYSVKFSASAKLGIAYVRNVLNAIIDQYTLFYSEKYLYNASLADIEKDLSVENYDYLDIVKIIDKKISAVKDYIGQLDASRKDFRSATTGYTFEDINRKLDYIYNVQIPILYGEIYENSITKNKDNLFKYYMNKIDDSNTYSKTNHLQSERTNTIMKEYAKKNKLTLWDSPNSGGSDQKNQVTEVNDTYEYSKAKTTYDELIDDYVNYEKNSRIANLDAEDYKKTIERFNRSDVSPTTTQIMDVENKIENIKKDASEFLEDAFSTITDYNSFISAESIQYISGILVSEKLYRNIYLIVFFVMGFSLSTVFVVLLNIYKNVRIDCLRRRAEQEKEEQEE